MDRLFYLSILKVLLMDNVHIFYNVPYKSNHTNHKIWSIYNNMVQM